MPNDTIHRTRRCQVLEVDDLPAVVLPRMTRRPVSHRVSRRIARGCAPVRRVAAMTAVLDDAGRRAHMWIAPATVGPRRLRVDGTTYERTAAPVEAIVDHGVSMVVARYRGPSGEPVALLRGVGVDAAGPVIVAGGFLILT